MHFRDIEVNRAKEKTNKNFGEHRLSDIQIRFGENLRKVRQKAAISQEKLAELAGLHRTYVSSIERGERNISLLNIEKLAIALAVPLAKLMP